MLELVRTQAEVVRCFARPDVLDTFPEIEGAFGCRVAPNEIMLVAPGRSRVAEAAERLVDADPHGLAVGENGGWAVWTISGPEAAEAFSRLSAVPLQPGFLQGRIGGVPAKGVVLEDRILLLVVSSLGHHLEARIRAACADLLPQEDEES